MNIFSSMYKSYFPEKYSLGKMLKKIVSRKIITILNAETYYE